MRLSTFLLAATLACIPGLATADELADLKARNAQLEATVEELTLQLAEAISARKQLEAKLAASVSAASATVSPAGSNGAAQVSEAPALEQTTVSGGATVATLQEETISSPNSAPVARANTACDVSRALRGYDGSGDDNQALKDWLTSGDQVKRCSVDELKRLREAVSWDWYGYQKEVYAIIDRELKQR